MQLAYKPDFDETARRWEAYWEGEVPGRPLICVTAPRDGCERRWHGIDYRRVVEARGETDYKAILDAYDAWLSATAFLGESVPHIKLDYGPDMFAAFFGAPLQCSTSDAVDTTWVTPIVEAWDDFAAVMQTGEGSLYRRFMELTAYAAEYGEGKFLLSVADIHSNMDTLSALRGAENLCFDLMDYPDEVEAALKRVRACYEPFYNEAFKAGRMDERGSMGWVPLYTRGRYATVQCDYACLISPEQGRRYVIPSIEEETALLDHAAYHYDGKEALVHLDSILAVEGIDAIQWVPGDGNPRSIEWMDLLHKIQAAGKGLWIYDWTAEEIKARFRDLKPEGLVFSVDVASESEARDLLDYVEKHM